MTEAPVLDPPSNALGISTTELAATRQAQQMCQQWLDAQSTGTRRLHRMMNPSMMGASDLNH